MFWTVPLSIIRRFHCAHSKHARHIPLLCVQWKTGDDGQRNCPKHVEHYSQNKFEKLVHLLWRERERTNKMQKSDIYYQHCLNMFPASLCPSSGEQRPCVTACGILRWFCWMWLVAVVGRCVVGCEHCEGYCSTVLCCGVRALWRLLSRTVTFTVLAPHNAAQSNSNLHSARTPQRSTVEQ